MIKKILLLLFVFAFSLHFSVTALDSDIKEQIEFHLCGTKEKPLLKCVRGIIELFCVTFERYEVEKGTFIVEHQIRFPEMFKVKMDTNVKGCNVFGSSIEIATAGFLSLDKLSFDSRYFLKLVNYSFQDNVSTVKYSIDLFVPERTYSQYRVQQVSSNTYLLQRKAEINPRLMASLSSRLGTDSDFFLKAIPDDFVCSIKLEKNGITSFYEKILYFPW
jgi:hypothetical protein